ncbi:FAD-dependent oxidoreductase [Agromyces sp. Leaf222]|uniref:FAD-dependent oxidoreductase n=1 Tax=Agromyces sp. Leaf222 TaxID=1735688 RepID=UPI0006F728A9|nr:FAD-dependent oxidoreductase [Agromyces sp. Leaf222]KQM80609.1 FAD-dependent oxidoreductase [Agromyces sp. Leaf222]
MTDHDVIVVGGGAMGSAAAWQLASRGRDVLLLERFAEGHASGASHGASRNFNVSYADAAHVALLVEAGRQWRELEAETGTSLLAQVGIVNHGDHPDLDAVHAALGAVGIPSEFLPASEAGERWPGLRFTTRVLHTPTAGRLNADASVRALQQAAAARGAEVRHEAPVRGIRVLDDDRVEVTLDDDAGEAATFTARRVIVAAGAWTSKLVGGLLPLPELVVTQEQPGHFAVIDTSFEWPGFNHRPGPGDEWWYSGVYGMLTPGEGVKAGWHGTGPVVDPDRRDFTAEPVQFEALRRYVREWIPGADADAARAISCTYTTSPDSVFVLDAVGPLVVAAGFSGHGFKFTPAIGRVLADLAEGRTSPEPFRLARFA